MALDKLTKVQSVGISSFIQVVGVVTATQGFDGNITGIITATGDFSIADKIVHTGDTNTALRFPAADTVTVETAGSERFRVESGGNIGIGTNDANNLLHVYGGQIKAQSNPSDTSTNLDLIRAQCGSSGNALFSIRAADAADNNSNWDIKTNANEDLTFTIGGATERLRILSSGQVVIGESTNYANANADDLIVGNRSNNESGITIGSSNQGQIAFADSGADRAGLIHYQHTDNSMRLYTNGPTNERLRINSDGDVKIKSFGNASNGSADALQIGKTDNNYGITILSATNAQGRIDFTDTEDTNDPQGKIAYYHDSNSLQFFTNGGAASNERLRITSGGNVQITDGNLVVASGHGIDFSADGNASGMTSELLDDYEEGTFTPIVRGRTTAGTATYGRTAVGKYTKVGRMVDVMVDMVFSGANGSGNIEIAGLPYAAHNGPYVRFAGDVTLLNAGISWSNQIACYINDTNSHFWITNTPTSGNYTFVNINSNTTEILIHCTYMVS